MNQSLQASFKKKGFIHLKEVLNASEVARLREEIETRVQSISSKSDCDLRKSQCLPHEALEMPSVCSLSFNTKVVQGLKTILGDGYSTFPDFHIQYNMIGTGQNGGWHVDSGSERGAKYLLSPDYRFVKCGIFLQDNSVDWGGGIDVVPGGHKFPIRTGIPKIDFKAKQIFNKFQIKYSKVTVPIKAGDFVAFESRLPHTSTWPNQLKNPDISHNVVIRNLPKEHTKIVFYWNAASKQSVSGFVENSIRRANLELKSRNQIPFFMSYLKNYFPDSFPKDFVEKASESGVEVVSLNRNESQNWQKNFDSVMSSN